MSVRISAPLFVMSLFGALFSVSSATAIELRPAMRPVVTCVFDMVRSHPDVLSVDVYDDGPQKYVIEYKFRQKGAIFTGGMGLWDRALDDGKYSYTNETPSGQQDNFGAVELDFLGNNTMYDMYERCHLMPTFDDTIGLPGDPPAPPRQKVDMSTQAN